MKSFVAGSDEISKVLSNVKVLRIKEWKNQLVDAERTIFNLRQENRKLQNILNKVEHNYGGKNANLMQILNDHADKISNYKRNFRNLQKELYEKREQLQDKVHIVDNLKETIKKKRELNMKNLGLKENLQRKIYKLNLEIITKSRQKQKTVENLRSEIALTKQQLINAKRRNKLHSKNRKIDVLALQLLKDYNFTT